MLGRLVWNKLAGRTLYTMQTLEDPFQVMDILEGIPENRLVGGINYHKTNKWDTDLEKDLTLSEVLHMPKKYLPLGDQLMTGKYWGFRNKDHSVEKHYIDIVILNEPLCPMWDITFDYLLSPK